jgi:hypothetical protein
MAKEVVNRRLNIFIDESGANQALERLRKQEEKLVQTIQKGTAAGKDMSKEMEKLGRTQSQIKQVSDVLSGKLLPNLSQARASVSRLEAEIRKLAPGTADFNRKAQELQGAYKVLDTVRAKVTAIRTELNAGQGGFGKLLSGGSNVTSSLLAGVGIGVGAGLATGAISFLKDVFAEALEAEQETKRLQNTLSNLGRADVFDSLRRKADEFAKRFTFLDNDQIVGLFNRLITYGKLTRKQIEDLTPVIVNFASKSNTSLEEATETIIKGLEGNGKALKTYGINLKDAKTDTERFNIVMTTLKEKVEGAADAFGETTQGRIASTQQHMKDLKEEIGTRLIPVVNGLLKAFNFVLIGAEDLAGKIKDVFQLTFDFQQFIENKAAESQADREQTAAEEAEVISRKFSSLTDKQLAERTKKEHDALSRVEKLLENSKKKQLTDEVLADRDYYRQRIENEKALIDALNKESENRKNVKLGIQQQEAEADAKERAKQLKELKDELKGIEQDLHLSELTEFHKKLEEIDIRFDALLKRAGKSKDLIAQINSLRQQSIDRVFSDLVDTLRDKVDLGGLLDIPSEKIEKVSAKLFAIADKAISGFLDKLNRDERDKIAQLQLNVIESTGRKRLDAQLKLLEEEKNNEIKNKDHTLKEVELLEEQYRQKSTELEKQFFLDKINLAIDFAASVVGVFSRLNSVLNESQNIDLDNERALNDQRKGNFQDLLDQKLISQKQYDKEIKRLDKEQSINERKLKKEQFERNKIVSIAQAGVNTAEGVTKAYAQGGGILGPLLAGFVAAAGLLEIALISQENPSFGKGGIGGIPDGPSHGSSYGKGGIKLIRRDTGREVGEMQGGEPIISRGVYRANKSIVDALLHKGWQSDHTPLNPGWISSPTRFINSSRINQSMHRLGYFATGGIAPGGSSDQGSSDAQFTLLLQNIFSTNQAILQRLNEPFFSDVIYGTYEAKAKRITGIRDEGMIN